MSNILLKASYLFSQLVVFGLQQVKPNPLTIEIRRGTSIPKEIFLMNVISCQNEYSEITC